MQGVRGDDEVSQALRQKITEGLKLAMKAQDKLRLDAIRYVLALVKNAEIDVKRELEDSEVIKIIRGEVKKRQEAIGLIRGGGREELAREEEAKVKVLQEFLPEEMNEEEIGNLVNKVIGESGTKEFGAIMREVMQQAAGRAEGKLVAEVVKERLGLTG